MVCVEMGTNAFWWKFDSRVGPLFDLIHLYLTLREMRISTT